MRTVVAMSGGVDSSVAAALLHESGREVVGISLHVHGLAHGGGYGRCCSPDDFRDARRVAGRLEIPYYVLDEEETFRRRVVERFVDEYRRGRTPSPCVLCNSEVKFGGLLERARALGAERIATGHYARIEREGPRFRLLRGKDRSKDQSYFLFGLDQEQLACAEFPVGELTKDEVRAAARRLDLPVWDKPESQEICFVEGTSYRAFVRDRSGDLGPPGDVVSVGGERLAAHDGIGAFTVGQRRGLGIPASEPLYVIGLEAATGRVVVGPEEHLLSRSCTVSSVNWIPVEPRQGPVECEVKIRSRHEGARARVLPHGGGSALVEFASPQRAVAPGQAAVFYDGDAVLGGGWIAEARS